MKSEINIKKSIWRLNNTLLKDERMIEEIREEIQKFLESNKNSDTTHQNLWNTMKDILKRQFTAINACIRKSERFPINNLMMYLKALEK